MLEQLDHIQIIQETNIHTYTLSHTGSATAIFSFSHTHARANRIQWIVVIRPNNSVLLVIFMYYCLQSRDPKPRKHVFTGFSSHFHVCEAAECSFTCTLNGQLPNTQGKSLGYSEERPCHNPWAWNISEGRTPSAEIIWSPPACPERGKECVALPSSRSPSLNTLPCSYYYPFFTSNCSVMVIVRSSPWRNYLQLT